MKFMKKNDKFKLKLDRSRDDLLTDFSKATLKDRYLLKEESFQDLFGRVACAYSDDQDHAQRMYEYMSKLWFMPATPILSNGGTKRGLPISCFLNHVSDSLNDITDVWTENVHLASNGGGIGTYWGDVRSMGENVRENGKTTGIIPYIKVMDSISLSVSQGSVRKGSAAVYIPIHHPEIIEFLEIRRPTGGDPNRKSLNLHHGVVIDDKFMEALEKDSDYDLLSPKDKKVIRSVKARDLWERLLTARVETGEPYILFSDSINNNKPEHQKFLELDIKTSNLCFSGDNMILTQSGYKKLRDLWIEDGEAKYRDKNLKNIKIVNRNGIVDATQIYKTSDSSEVFEVEFSKGYKVRATLDHNFILRDNSRVKLKDLKIGDFVNLSNKTSFGDFSDKIYAELAGFVIGGGSLCKSDNKIKAILRLWNDDINKYEKYWSKLLDKLFWSQNYDTSLGSTNKKQDSIFKFNKKFIEQFNYNRASVGSFTLGRMLSNDGINVGDKHNIPNSIYRGTEEVICSFLRGIFSADGYVGYYENKKSCVIFLDQVDKRFLEQIQILLLQIGITTSLKSLHKDRKSLMNNGKGGKSLYQANASYRLSITSRDNIEKFLNKIKFVQEEKNEKIQSYLKSTIGSNNSFIKFYDKIKSISYVGEEETFCLTEKNNNEVVVNGIVIGQCSEIVLPTGYDYINNKRTAVCCLSSFNLEYYEEWKDNDKIYEDVIKFIDNVLSDFIYNSPKEFINSKYSALMERSVGIGVMGFHSYLQSKLIPIESALSIGINKNIFKNLKSKLDFYNEKLGEEKGSNIDYLVSCHIKHKKLDIKKDKNSIEKLVQSYLKNKILFSKFRNKIKTDTLYFKKLGYKPKRFSNITSIAPTASISIICGATSPSIEPIFENCFVQKTLSGSFIMKNKYLRLLLKEKELDNEETWTSILSNNGSVQHLDFLEENEKSVFKTAFEINQVHLIKLMGDRAEFIDQACSNNIFVKGNCSKDYLHQIHYLAWKNRKIKSLYYCRSSSIKSAEKISKKIKHDDQESLNYQDCLVCQ